MTDKDNPQPDEVRASKHTPEDEIDFIELLEVLLTRKTQILIITLVFAISPIVYFLWTTPVYHARIGVRPHTGDTEALHAYASSIPKSLIYDLFALQISSDQYTVHPNGPPVDFVLRIINKANNKYFFVQFLNRIQSKNHHQKVFENGSFYEKFSSSIGKPTNPDQLLQEIYNSLALRKRIKNEKFTYISVEGPNPEELSNFINALAETAITDIRDETLNLLKIKIKQQTEVVSNEIESTRRDIKKQQLDKAIHFEKIYEQKRKTILDKIASLRKQKRDKIKYQLASLRLEAKEKRLNTIISLTEELIFARKLNPNDNNLKYSPNPPDWFLYGTSALEKRIRALKSRTNDDPYNPSIGRLLSELKASEIEPALNPGEAENNGALSPPKIISLQTELDALDNNLKLSLLNTPFPKGTSKLPELQTKLAQLKSIDISKVKPDIVVIDEYSTLPANPENSKKPKVIFIGVLLGLFMGIVIAFLSNSVENFRKRNEKSSLT